ncbi:hypothetical protein AWM79_03520 [Pseudomonas agarici]|uniref:Uncharacterized protein n=1 Tax=Pseudomonas agarici TaxID=46677 RepID=A0A0X1SX23_PSEAA|nr:hypothetical protein [Pseudomonas agarici]AMB84423.1 hypothetical protein AWM79_03520 [Pseudomonas agarici]NWB89619.1 hypothetical protein [Pseudomonas agarici]NWC10321.1 hypothetical protein [Pseudomonas agarici]
MKNDNNIPLTDLSRCLTAYASADIVNPVENSYTAPRYAALANCMPRALWEDCLPIPPLRPS